MTERTADPRGAGYWMTTARAMAAHLRTVMTRGRTCPDVLAIGPWRHTQTFFFDALEALRATQRGPKPEHALALMRVILAKISGSAPHTDDEVYDRLRAYTHVLDQLGDYGALGELELRDARELLTFCQRLAELGEEDEPEEVIAFSVDASDSAAVMVEVA